MMSPITRTTLVCATLLAAACSQQGSPAMGVAKKSLDDKLHLTRVDGKLICIYQVERCIVPVYVEEEGDGCVVYITTGTIEVEKRPLIGILHQVKVVWTLNHANAPAKLKDYEFDKDAGIKRIAKSASAPDNETEAAIQFDETVRESALMGEARPWRYRWRSTHVYTGGEVKYLPKVWRDVRGVPVECRAEDPIIKNTS